MTDSQKKTIDFYKNNSAKFDNIISETVNNEGVVTLNTKAVIYRIGILGGVTSEPKKPQTRKL